VIDRPVDPVHLDCRRARGLTPGQRRLWPDGFSAWTPDDPVPIMPT
jgi:hypothetical protein